ncbi:MAG: hypothetical protein U0518_03380 [Candidatus Gracilibacteria bacterium]
MEQIINTLRSGLQKTGLSGDPLEQSLAHTIESLERLTFGRILSEKLTPDEVEIYKELLETDGEVDGYGFLKGIRPNEVDHLIQDIFIQEVRLFLQSL